MNRDKLKLWIDALRSGEFEQGREGLAKDGKFCCLGVACEVAISDGVGLEVNRQGGSLFDEYDNESGFLPRKVQDWLGTVEGAPEVEWDSSPGGVEHVAYLNDSQHLTFHEIADLLEKTYLKEESK